MARLTALFNRPPITWWDVLDILIVSLVIYEALKLIRGTRAMQMAIGSLLVLLLFYASTLFPLQTVSWLIRNVLAYVVFAAIVLFQSDIRRALSHLGRARFFRYLSRVERAAETIEEVVTATGMLAKDRVGAIIVLEREIGLRNYVESGIPIDAEVSYDLLTTIFQPSTPMHDGAVIIQEDRIAAAACFLPLTVNPKLDRDLGTRHRAAIGLTEECDAVAVVVSEERGEISLSLNGRIARGLTLDELRVRLQTLILPRRRARAAASRSTDSNEYLTGLQDRKAERH
jgi:diadenylate cyclase